MLYKKWTKKITISHLSVCLFILHPKKSPLYTQWHLIKAYHLHFFIQVSYFEFYLGLFIKCLYLQKQNAFLKQNKSLFLLEKNPLVERKIKLLKVMTTEKRSNQCLWHSAVHAALDGAFVRGSPLQNLTRTKPFFKKNHPLAAVWTIYNQHCFLALSQLWHVHYFKILSAHPSSDLAQLSLWQKGSLGSNLMLILRNMNSVLAALSSCHSSSMRDLQRDH